MGGGGGGEGRRLFECYFMGSGFLYAAVLCVCWRFVSIGRP